jgi:cation transport protein ChaC
VKPAQALAAPVDAPVDAGSERRALEQGSAAAAPLLLADWVFAYGSLIWNPEFEPRESSLARVHGWHRAFCIRSTRYRGDASQPGVVLGLERGGSCVGVAMRLAHATRRRTIEALYAREMLNDVYVPRLAAVTLRNGRQLRALTFVANHASPAWERLREPELLHRLAHARGERGSNRDYAMNTWRALAARGVHDPRLARLAHQLEAALSG